MRKAKTLPVCECNVGPGKFEGEGPLTALAYWHAGNGGSDITTGTDLVTDWFRAPLGFDADTEAVTFARNTGYCEPCIAEALEAEDGGGLAFWEDSQGFAYVATFADRATFDAAVDDALEDDASEDVYEEV